jgi:hypothetical protein
MFVDDGDFGKCSKCGYTFNSELINEYDIKHCPDCGKKLYGKKYLQNRNKPSGSVMMNDGTRVYFEITK